MGGKEDEKRRKERKNEEGEFKERMKIERKDGKRKKKKNTKERRKEEKKWKKKGKERETEKEEIRRRETWEGRKAIRRVDSRQIRFHMMPFSVKTQWMLVARHWESNIAGDQRHGRLAAPEDRCQSPPAVLDLPQHAPWPQTTRCLAASLTPRKPVTRGP